MKILGGSNSYYIAKQLSDLLNIKYIPVETRKFPDGEIYVRIDGEVSKEDIIVVQSLAKHPNDSLVELIFICRTLEELNASRIYAFIPYFAYARQDTRFKQGEAVSLDIVANLLEWSGIDEIITIDFHLHRRKPEEIFKIPIHNLSAMRKLSEYILKNYRFSNLILVGPDEESEQWVKTFVKYFDTPYIILEKTRLGDENVIIKSEEELHEANEAIVIDDIVSTGGTLRETAIFLRNKGIKKLYAVVTHALLAPASEYNLSYYNEIISTDSIVNPYAKVKVAEIFTDFIRRRL